MLRFPFLGLRYRVHSGKRQKACFSARTAKIHPEFTVTSYDIRFTLKYAIAAQELSEKSEKDERKKKSKESSGLPVNDRGRRS